MTERRQRRTPGILAFLPESLPYYPYRHDNCGPNRLLNICTKRGRRRERLQRDADVEVGRRSIDCQKTPHLNNHCNDSSEIILNAPLLLSDRVSSVDAYHEETQNRDRFTLFFFVDSTNKQSLIAIPIVSKWCRHAFYRGDLIQNDPVKCSNRVICIPNQSAECFLNPQSSGTEDDPCTVQVMPILLHSGFFQLSSSHPSYVPLVHVLAATRVPSIIVVDNDSGRIVTKYAWEAIEREGNIGGSLDTWIEKSFLCNKKCENDQEDSKVEHFMSPVRFHSQVVKEWRNGRSGLPLWWHLLHWVI